MPRDVGKKGAKRRPLTAEEKRWAENARRLWEKMRKDPLRKMSQADAAYKVGINQSAFSQFLNGRVPLNTDMKIKFAGLLGVDVSEIDESLGNTLPTPQTKAGGSGHSKLLSPYEKAVLEIAASVPLEKRDEFLGFLKGALLGAGFAVRDGPLKTVAVGRGAVSNGKKSRS